MLTPKLVRLIEEHSDELANALVNRIRNSHHVTVYKHLPEEELRDIAFEVYHHLGDWLLTRTEADIEQLFTTKARQRQSEHVPLSDMVWVTLITKETLWRYLQTNAPVDKAFEILGELELMQATDHFFDRGIYYATRAYEHARAAA